MRRTILSLIWLQAMIPPAIGTGKTIDLNDSVMDVFPLLHNGYYAYNYRAESRFTELVYLVQLSVDSGLVEYVVSDSITVNDSTVAWNLEERKVLWHRRYDARFNRDSMYWTYDSIFFQLFEATTGSHEITSSGLIWGFPLSTPSQSVYRFADSAQITLARQWSTPSGSGVDTLKFSDTRGLFHRHKSYFGGGITHFSSSLNVELQGNPVVGVIESTASPTAVELKQNYPNPFNPTTIISFAIGRQSSVSLKVFDLLGREVATLVNQEMQPGRYNRVFDGSGLASGVYLSRLQAGAFAQTRKLLMLR